MGNPYCICRYHREKLEIAIKGIVHSIKSVICMASKDLKYSAGQMGFFYGAFWSSKASPITFIEAFC